MADAHEISLGTALRDQVGRRVKPFLFQITKSKQNGRPADANLFRQAERGKRSAGAKAE